MLPLIDLGGPTPIRVPNSGDACMRDVLFVFQSERGFATYLVPFKEAEPYLPAAGHIINVSDGPTTEDDQFHTRLVEHFALKVGQEPCFLPSVPSLAEYITLVNSGPGVPEGGVKSCAPPWSRFKVPPVGEPGFLKHVVQVVPIGWIL